jgi:hypothetical protein
MEFHLDRTLRLVTEVKPGSYPWAIAEIDAQGQQVGGDQIPWEWTAHFTASSCNIVDGLQINIKAMGEKPFAPETEVIRDQIIHIELRPVVGSIVDSMSFSMFGADRFIDSFRLDVYSMRAPVRQEICTSWGTVSYTSTVEFQDDIAVDCLLFNMIIAPDTFANYKALLNGGAVDQVIFSASDVAGFYAPWVPWGLSRKIKVLTGGKEQVVTVPADFKGSPPRLGSVGGASLQFSRRIQLQGGAHD